MYETKLKSGCVQMLKLPVSATTNLLTTPHLSMLQSDWVYKILEKPIGQLSHKTMSEIRREIPLEDSFTYQK